MKRISLLLTGICIALSSLAQTDSTTSKSDTIRIGSMIIIKKDSDRKTESAGGDSERTYSKKRKKSNLTTNWWIVDLGIAQLSDYNNYTALVNSGVLPAGANEDWMNLRTGKSINVNIWAFMQKMNIIKHVVNLKYGLGIELNNYTYRENIKYTGTRSPILNMDSRDFSKNKLAADYITVPMMLNFDFTPNRRKGFNLSIGASAGYLYSARQKTKGGGAGKVKEYLNYDLDPWKISYVGELGLGPVRLYGSLATKSMYKNSLDMTPYNVGIRLSNW